MAMQWYVVHTFSGHENKAKLALEDAIRRYGVGDRFGDVLVPTEKVVDDRGAAQWPELPWTTRAQKVNSAHENQS